MTTKLGVLAKVLAVVVLLAAPAAAQKRKAPKRARVALKASATKTEPARLRVCRAKRVENKATPSIEPDWGAPAPAASAAPLLARR